MVRGENRKDIVNVDCLGFSDWLLEVGVKMFVGLWVWWLEKE